MRKLAATLIVASTLSGCAQAVCQAPGPRLVCAEYFKSKVVVEAKLLRKRAIIDKDGSVTANIYYMQADEVLRGSITQDFEIYEGNDSGRAGFYWTTGRSYLLFLFPSLEAKGAVWGLDGCGNSGPLEKKRSLLQEIAQIKQRSGGMIQVAVGDGSISCPVKGVHVTVRGDGRSLSGTTSENGRSEIHVPPGNYSLSVKGEKPYEPYFLGYERPNNIEIENGSCAQVQFVEADKNR